ncbi:hypothetical protein ACFVHW_04490 [Streptomyces sp. NPDC127110]|uniref:hypothetical protein n=1 Tax=Streptomyces sp. NPDC127110 TaxID=3345362 RepID=UPI0036328E9F
MAQHAAGTSKPGAANAPNDQRGTTVAGRVPPERQRTTLKPSGLPSWPIVLLAGTEKSGKSYEAAEFSGSDLIGRTFWIEIGEGEGHHYGAVPGARYELVRHDGSFRDILDAVRWAVWQGREEDGKPNAIVLDSVSILWELLGDEQAVISRRRAAERAARQKQPAPPDPADYTITTDQWNVAKRRWAMVIDALRGHDGPVILCARMDEVTLFDAAGQPTKERTWKIQAEKKLPFEVTATVQLRGYRRAYLTGVRSLRLNRAPDRTDPYPGFSLDKLMRDLGLDELATAERTYVTPQPEAYEQEYDDERIRLADRNDRSRDARRQAAQGKLPVPRDVAAAIRNAHQAKTDQHQELVKVRAFYGPTVLAQVVVDTPWGEMDASTAIDSAILDIAKRNKEEGQQPGQASKQPNPPTSHTPELRPEGEGETAVGPHAHSYADAAAGEGALEPTAALPDGVPERVPAGRPTADRARSRQGGVRERAQERMVAELNFQAHVLGQDPLAFAAAILPDGATDLRQVLSVKAMQDHIREYRSKVFAALVKQGRRPVAGEYAKYGTRVPAPPSIEAFIQGVLEPQPNQAETPVEA